jgi:hypothetical protein
MDSFGSTESRPKIRRYKRSRNDIAKPQTKHKLITLMLDNAGENYSQEIEDLSSPRMFKADTVHHLSNGKMVSRRQLSVI